MYHLNYFHLITHIDSYFKLIEGYAKKEKVELFRS